ncbi:MAG: DUF5676 family membrane protein [Nannocystales bacterium]
MTNNEATANHGLQIQPLGHAMASFLGISYLVCIAFGLAMPESLHMHTAWSPLLPGFEWLTLPGFFIGLAESYLYGWYFAFIFVPLYRRFDK